MDRQSGGSVCFFLLKLLFFALNNLGRGVFDVYFADVFDFLLVFIFCIVFV